MKLGEHKGFPYYTIGQRKGLEIALGKPAYVLKINPQKNTVMLGDAEQLKTGYMLAEHENLVDEGEFFESKELTVGKHTSERFTLLSGQRKCWRKQRPMVSASCK